MSGQSSVFIPARGMNVNTIPGQSAIVGPTTLPRGGTMRVWYESPKADQTNNFADLTQMATNRMTEAKADSGVDVSPQDVLRIGVFDVDAKKITLEDTGKQRLATYLGIEEADVEKHLTCSTR